MSKKLSTGITSRQHTVDSKVVTQYRGRIQDRSRRTPKGTLSTKSSRYFDRMSEAKAWLGDQRKLLNTFGSLYAHLFKEMAGHANRIGADLEHLILGRPKPANDTRNRAMNG